MQLVEERIFEIVYRLTHLAELYDQFAAFSMRKSAPAKSLKEFATELKEKGHPFGEGLQLKQTTSSNTMIPIFELYELYKEYPNSPPITVEEFSRAHKSVDKFRRETGQRGFIKE